MCKTSCKHVRVMYTRLHPTFIYKTGVYRGIHFFLIFALKHRLWVLRVPTINVWSKNKKNIAIFQLKISIFTVAKNYRILHGRVCVMAGARGLRDMAIFLYFSPGNESFPVLNFLTISVHNIGTVTGATVQ